LHVFLKSSLCQALIIKSNIKNQIGHATQLIQTSGMNILTDPVFGDLAPVVYPSMTKRFEQTIKADDLPHIDVIIISHNHRDHVDENSLKLLIKKAQDEGLPLPQLLVPMGDEDFFRGLGFTDVKAFEWHEQITLYSKTNEPITFCSEPADHRSGRNGYDAHESLVMGWTVSQKNRSEILYFAGDTARINDIRMNSLALDIYQLYQHKKGPNNWVPLPQLINMEPGGPNYTRKEMEPTQFGPGEVSTIMPDTFFTDKHKNVKRKGEKIENTMNENSVNRNTI